MGNAENAKNIFLEAIEITEADERSDFLATARDGNAELRRRVDRLIHAHELDDSLLDHTVDLRRSAEEPVVSEMEPYTIREMKRRKLSNGQIPHLVLHSSCLTMRQTNKRLSIGKPLEDRLTAP